MKNIFTIILIGLSCTIIGQNEMINVQQQVNWNTNLSNVYNNTPQVNNINPAIQQRSINRSARRNINLQVTENNRNYSNEIMQQKINSSIDNVGEEVQNQNKVQMAQLSVNTQELNIDMPNVNINLPKISFGNKNKEEKVEIKSTKRLEDYRIKTSGGNGVSHQKRKMKSAPKIYFKKRVKCWINKHFAKEIKFKVSCDCFNF